MVSGDGALWGAPGSSFFGNDFETETGHWLQSAGRKPGARQAGVHACPSAGSRASDGATSQQETLRHLSPSQLVFDLAVMNCQGDLAAFAGRIPLFCKLWSYRCEGRVAVFLVSLSAASQLLSSDSTTCMLLFPIQFGANGKLTFLTNSLPFNCYTTLEFPSNVPGKNGVGCANMEMPLLLGTLCPPLSLDHRGNSISPMSSNGDKLQFVY
jgi:hypothetical protein